MKLRQAAALALLIALGIGCTRAPISWTLIFPPLTEDDYGAPIGWTLIFPPLTEDNSGSLTQPDIKAPMNEWIIADGSSATLRECEQFRTQEAFSPLRAAGLCLRDDDPRLKTIFQERGQKPRHTIVHQFGHVLIMMGAFLSAFALAGFLLAYYRGSKDAARVFLLSFVFGVLLLCSGLLLAKVKLREPESELVMAIAAMPAKAPNSASNPPAISPATRP